ncbi:MAG: amylo-alpha-1,6-glucosidase, partial [Bacteroidales bacterium]|nr:amylo-alpha-1,6-glucosidase [Bacteroidales bacterium]
PGESVYFCAGLSPLKKNDDPEKLFTQGVQELIPLDSSENCLKAAAASFIVRKEKRLQVMAGYPWFGSWGRDTFIALPGLTLCTGREDDFLDVMRAMLQDQVGGLFPNVGYGEASAYNSVDAPLWFVWALQQYALHTGDIKAVWREFGDAAKQVIENYASGQGSQYGIGRGEDGLIYAGRDGFALTWMDAVVGGRPVTPRDGADVEINALWYNAVMFAIEAEKACGKGGDTDFVKTWEPRMEQFPATFKQTFWDKEKGYLADTVKNGIRDWSIRPNQIIAVSLPYSPVSEKVGQLVVDTVRTFLLTPRGLRTLSPSDSRYKGVYRGDQDKRDMAYHQGTVWPWLLGHFAEACIKVYGESGRALTARLYEDFEPALGELCLGSISEIYDGDPCYAAKGAVSQAWSVAELLRMKAMIDNK